MTPHIICVVFVVGCDGSCWSMAGATMAALSKEAELLGAMHIGRLLMGLGML